MEGWVELGYPAMHLPGSELGISRSQVRHPNHYTPEPPTVQVKVRVLAMAQLTWVKTQDQVRLTMSVVANDWHELMIPRRIVQSSIARANEQLEPQCSTRHTTASISLRPVASKSVLIFHPAEGRRLSWTWSSRKTLTACPLWRYHWLAWVTVGIVHYLNYWTILVFPKNLRTVVIKIVVVA